MDLKKVEDILLPYLLEKELTLYDLNFIKEYGYNILRVLIDKKGGIDLGTLALVNEYLSTKLDVLDVDMTEYLLEVSSPGAEKAIRNLDELRDAVGQYINVKIKEMVYEGILIDFSDDILELEINIKGRLKRINLEYKDVKKIRHAVHI